MKKLSLLILLLAVIIGGIWYFQRQQEPPTPHVEKLVKTDPLKLNSPYLQQGLSWRTRTIDQIKGDEGWIDSYYMVTRSEIIEVDEQNGSHVLLTIDECGTPEGYPHHSTATQMVGRQFDYRISSDGKVHSIAIYDGKSLEYMEIIFFFMAVGGSDMSGLFQKNSVVPGDQWPDQYEGKVPGYPNSYIKSESSCQFIGYEMRDGVEVGIIRAHSKISIGGDIPIEKTVEPKATHYLTLEHIDIESNGEYIVDMQSGRIVSGEGTAIQSGLKGTVTSMIQGRRVPVRETIEGRPPGESRSFITLEYLQ
jgi:hypothetical protein